MRFLPSDKYNVAWFKLAECVSRGEKERALGVYRLLIHSFEDKAFARQLEGDIFLAFGDEETAAQKYGESVDLYKKDGRLFDAAGVCEHLLTLGVDTHTYRPWLIGLYKNLHNMSKVIEHMKKQCYELFEKKKIESAEHLLEELDDIAGPEFVVKERQLLVFIMIKNECNARKISRQIQKTLDGILQFEDAAVLQRFLLKLEQTDQDFYMQATELIKESLIYF